MFGHNCSRLACNHRWKLYQGNLTGMKQQLTACQYRWAAQLFADVGITVAAEPWDLLPKEPEKQNIMQCVITITRHFMFFKDLGKNCPS